MDFRPVDPAVMWIITAEKMIFKVVRDKKERKKERKKEKPGRTIE